MARLLSQVPARDGAPPLRSLGAKVDGPDLRQWRQANGATCNPGVTPTLNKNGLPEGKPLNCLVAGGRNPTQKRLRIR